MNAALAISVAGISIGAVVLGLSVFARTERTSPSGLQLFAGTFTASDLTAVARMLASENPSGSLELWVEQVFTQIRSRKAGESLYSRITAGSGYGPQGKAEGGGRRRPVSTQEAETGRHLAAARAVLEGKLGSELPGARMYFEPKQQDRAFAIAEAARAKLAKGVELEDKEKRLLHYKKDAAAIRRDWQSKGHRLIGTIEGVEFYS